METATTEGRPLTRAVTPDRVDALAAGGRLASVLPGIAAALVIAGVGFADGGYFATAWGPVTLVFLSFAAVALLVGPGLSLGFRTLAMPALLGLLVLWTLASSAWGSPSEAVPEVERTLVYLSAALALGLVLRRGATIGVLIGLWAGIVAVCLYALATRLFPEQLAIFDTFAVYRLSEPVGYWNALGLLASFGLLLAFGLVARTDRLLVRLPAGASAVPLALTCYFTFSRGAWLALVAGLVVALVLDPRRLQLALTVAAIAPCPVLAVLIASRSGPLTESGSHTLAAAAEDGRALAAVGVGLTLFAGGGVALLAALEPRVRIARSARQVGNGVLLAGVIGAVVVGVFALGGPSKIARSFAAEPSSARVVDLDDRLFTLNGSGRADLWRVARDKAVEEPLVGSGAGSYQRYWLEHRPYLAPVRDAHSLYLEMSAELGLVGLALVLLLFGLPLVLAVRHRDRPLVPIAAAVLAAYVAHAGVDWDWEFPILTLVALGCAGVIVAEGVDRPSRTFRRGGIVLLCSLVALVPVLAVVTVGNRAEAASAEAFADRDFERAAAEAETAERWVPWSVEPLVLLGRAQSAAGKRGSARMTLRRAVSVEPESWRVWLELAAVSRGGERENALGRARALNPLESHIRDLEEGP